MSDSSIIFVELMRREREKIEKKLLFRPPGDCMNTNKEENKRLREKLREERANDDTTDKGSD